MQDLLTFGNQRKAKINKDVGFALKKKKTLNHPQLVPQTKIKSSHRGM